MRTGQSCVQNLVDVRFSGTDVHDACRKLACLATCTSIPLVVIVLQQNENLS